MNRQANRRPVALASAKHIACALIVSCAVAGGTAHAGNAFTTSYIDKESTEKRGDRVLADFASNASSAKRWKLFEFSEEAEGFGDMAATPFGDEVEYKINAMNYNLYLGDKMKLPFQLFSADLASNDSPAEANQSKLLDPTQGVAIQFPLAAVYKGKNAAGGLCSFEDLEGYCVLGGDVTLRGVRLNETDAAGAVHESSVFGASASLRASALFPIFEAVPGTTDQAGHLGFSVGARYYYHNTDKQNLLFEKMTDPDGTAIEFKKGFGALSVESEFDIYKYFKIRLEYFRPLNNRDALDDVVKASVVIAPKG